MTPDLDRLRALVDAATCHAGYVHKTREDAVACGPAHFRWNVPSSPDRVAGLREAAQAVMDVADYYTSEDDDSDPLWDHIPVELTPKLDALRAALEDGT